MRCLVVCNWVPSARWLLPPCLAALLLTSAFSTSASEPAATVVQLQVRGKETRTADGVRITRAEDTKRGRKTKIAVGDVLVVGDVIEVPKRTTITLRSANNNEITLHAGSRLRIATIADRGERYEQEYGQSTFSVMRALDFFEVTHRRILASVKGTTFAVQVRDDEIEFNQEEGEFVVRRPVKIAFAVEPGQQPRDYMVSERINDKNPTAVYPLGVFEYFDTFKNFQEAEAYFRGRLEEARALTDEEELWLALTNLGFILEEIGKADAVDYHRQALALSEKMATNSDILSARSLINLSGFDSDQGRYEVAWSRLERALEIVNADTWASRDDVIGVYNQAGVVAGLGGQISVAAAQFQQLIDLLDDWGQGESDSMMWALNNYGLVVGRAGDVEGAHALFSQALTLAGRLYPGLNHPAVFGLRVNELRNRMQLGDYAAAAQGMEQLLGEIERIYPDEANVFSAVLFGNLGVALSKNPKTRKKAWRYLERAHKANRKMYAGIPHQRIADDFKRFGNFVRDDGQPARAIEYYIKAQEVEYRLYPTGVHPEIADTYSRLGGELLSLEDWGQAQTMYEQCLGVLSSLYPQVLSPEKYRCAHNLATSTLWAEQYERFLDEAEVVLLMFDQIADPNEEELSIASAAANNIVWTYHELNRPDEAAPYEKRLAAIQLQLQNLASP